tara:strand:+ start:215 stop:442 length:228 start_codon:yes stop_codon:yes gene_type:complete
MATKKRTTLLTFEEARDLCNALDVLCSCYGDDDIVKKILRRYKPGTVGGERARGLFQHISRLSHIQIDQIKGLDD